MDTSPRQKPFTFVSNRARLTILSLGLLLTPTLELLINDFQISFVSPAWAESPLSVSKNTLIRRPTLSSGEATTGTDSTLSTSTREFQSVTPQPNTTTNSKEDSTLLTGQSVPVSSKARHPEPQPNESSTEGEQNVKDSDSLTPKEQQDTVSASNNVRASSGLTNSANLPIFSTPFASSPRNSKSSNNFTGIISPASALIRQPNQSVVPPSRKLTQRPGMKTINSPRYAPPSPQVTSPGPSVSPTPKPDPAPAPTPGPAPLSSATLTWNPNTDSDFSGYKVYRKTSPGDPYTTPIVTIQGNITTFHNIDLKVGTTYYFVVTAFDILGNESSFSNEVSQSIF